MNKSFFFISLFFFFIQEVINVYFIHCYLQPKYGKKSFIYSLLLLLTFLYILFNYIYTNVPLRMIIGVTYFEAIAFLFYNEKTFKKLLTGPILFICASFAEMIIQSILVFVLKMPIMTQLSTTVLFIMLFLNSLLFFIIVKLFLYFFSRSFYSTPQYSKLFFASITNVFLIAIIFSESLFLNQLFFVIPLKAHYTIAFIISSLCFLICILLNIYIYYSIQSLKTDLSKQAISQLMYTEYLSQINDLLLSKKTQQQTAYLRHDIMNYLQTISHYSQEDPSNVTKN